MGSSSSKRKVKVAMYAIPAAVAFGLAVSNYFQQSFGIYLKYQALVDSYYIKQRGAEAALNLGVIQDSAR